LIVFLLGGAHTFDGPVWRNRKSFYSFVVAPSFWVAITDQTLDAFWSRGSLSLVEGGLFCFG